jgi:hypothetical protein
LQPTPAGCEIEHHSSAASSAARATLRVKLETGKEEKLFNKMILAPAIRGNVLNFMRNGSKLMAR